MRGLAAYYRGDSGENKANWDRLDPKRKAYRIAQRLHEFTEVDAGDTADERIKALEKLAYREPILDRLRELNSELASQDWNKIFAGRFAPPIVAPDRSKARGAAHGRLDRNGCQGGGEL